MKITTWTIVRVLSVVLTACVSNVAVASDYTSLGKSCDSACDAGGFGCATCDGCSQCSGNTLYFGVEATYLAPQYSNGAASFTLHDDIALTSAQVGSSFDQADELTGAPRLTLGWVGKNGIGIQGRYWEMNNAVAPLDFPVLAPPGNQIQALGGTDSFEAYTVDLELTKQFSRGRWDFLGTFGARHADYDHTRTNSVAGIVDTPGATDIFSLGSLQGESFNGTGLTFSLAGLRAFKSNPDLALFTSARGSTLFGSAQTTAVASSSFGGTAGGAGSINGAIDDSNETMFIGEIQAGLRWSRCATSFRGRFFAQAAFEYQYWGTSDGSATATAGSGTVGESRGIVTVAGGKQDLDLVGFNLMTGFAW